MATWNSASYDGRYLQLYISETIDTINNTTKLDWKLSSIGGAANYYTIAETTVTINGVQVYHKGKTSWDSKVFPAAKGSVSGSITVSHDSNGSKSISVGFSTRVYYYQAQEYGGNMTLTNIDRTAPSVGFTTSNVTASSVKISVTSSATANKWWYSLNGGSSWTEFNSTDGTKKEITVTGLSPNTSYNIQVCARKKSNNVDGYSGKSTIKTLGNALLNSVSAVTADNATVQISFNWTVYSTGFTYSLAIKNGNTTVTTITIPTQSSTGTYDKTVTLTFAQRTALLNSMTSAKSFTGTFELKTLSGSTIIGSISSRTATVQTTSANSAPTFSNSAGFTYKDANADTVAVTGNDQIIVQTYSILLATAYEATAKNGATIKQYEATISGATVTSSTTSINCGQISKSGNLTLTVKAIDSRGYAVSVSKTIAVVAYEKADITEVLIRRKNEVEALTEVEVSAKIASIMVSGANKNALRYLQYRYKKTNVSTYGSTYTVAASDITISGNTVKFVTDEFISFDPDFSYNIQFWIYDKLTNDEYTASLAQGTPLVSKRRKRVGINNRNPQSALDVVGEIRMNGFNVMGVVSASIESGTNLNDITEPGIYFQRGTPESGLNYPALLFGMLEVFSPTVNYILQRYTQCDAPFNMYLRSRVNNTWSNWVEK